MDAAEARRGRRARHRLRRGRPGRRAAGVPDARLSVRHPRLRRGRADAGRGGLPRDRAVPARLRRHALPRATPRRARASRPRWAPTCWRCWTRWQIPRAVLAGYDWGGRAACVVAALWPERCAGLVSFNSYNIQNIATRAWSRTRRRTSTASGTSTTSTASAAAPGWRKDRRGLTRLLWQLWSPTWTFDDATFERSAAAFDNPDFVDVVIQSYRHRFGLVPGDPAYADIERAAGGAAADHRAHHHLRRRRRRRARRRPTPRRMPPASPARARTASCPASATTCRRKRRASSPMRCSNSSRHLDIHDRPPFKTLSEHRCFGGMQRFHEHDSREIGLPMRFSVFLPPQAANGPVPALLYLAGLTCNEETFMVKAGAQRLAAELGLALIAPDTSPRGAAVEASGRSRRAGTSASAPASTSTRPRRRGPRTGAWKAGSIDELLPLVGAAACRSTANASASSAIRWAAMARSRWRCAIRARFKSLSAFAPICAPTQCPWGEKAFTGYLGADRARWLAHDATRADAVAAASRPTRRAS